MKRLVIVTILFVLMAAGVAACAGQSAAPAAPAAEEAAPAEAAAPAAEAAATEAVEMPQPDPADQVDEATPPPAEEGASAAAGTRTFQIVPEQSSMQYFVEEEFFGQAVPFITAVGKTSALNGSVALQIEGNTVQIESGAFEADISTLTSDRPRRDQAIRDRWLQSSRYPIATFVAGEALNVPADADYGQDVAFQVSGDMTIREVTNPLTWDMTASIDGDTLAGTATTFFYMKDYGFDPPDIAGILRVTDGVTVTVDFVAQEVQ